MVRFASIPEKGSPQTLSPPKASPQKQVPSPKASPQKQVPSPKALVGATIVSAVKKTRDAKVGLTLGNQNNGTIVVGSIAEGGIFADTDLKIGMELVSVAFVALEGDNMGSMICKGKTTKEIANFIRDAEGKIAVEAVNPGGLEIIKGVSPPVIDMAKKFPIYGRVVKIIDECLHSSKNVKANKEAFQMVALWAKYIKAALFHVAPLLMQIKDVHDSLGPLMERFHECAHALLQMTQKFVSRHYILELITSCNVKSRFDDAKPMATALLMAIQITVSAVHTKYAAKPGPKLEYVERIMSQNINAMKNASLVMVKVDKELDVLIEEQHSSIELLNFNFIQNRGINVKMEKLLELVGQLDPARYLEA